MNWDAIGAIGEDLPLGQSDRSLFARFAVLVLKRLDKVCQFLRQ